MRYLLASLLLFMVACSMGKQSLYKCEFFLDGDLFYIRYTPATSDLGALIDNELMVKSVIGEQATHHVTINCSKDKN